MIIGILKEPDFDNRVSLLPEAVARMTTDKVAFLVEKEAGKRAFQEDAAYTDSGAEITDRDQLFSRSDILLSINPPGDAEVSKIGKGKVLVSLFNPVKQKDLLSKLKDQSVTVLGLDLIPRTTRAQAMDILSSMATIAGYKAVLTAAARLPKFFPMFMSAAGTIRPSRVLILGAGVAGLQAIAIARKLGAVVEVFDVRSAVKEEVESLGGKFVEVEGAREDAAAGGYAVEQTEEFRQKQMQLIHERALLSDVIIATAQIPGRQAPLLVKKETVENMKAGSVIVDLAASTGGNCELTENGKEVEKFGVRLIGRSDFPSETPVDASRMLGNNLKNLLSLFIGEEGELKLDFEDEIVKGSCATHEGEWRSERIKQLLNV